VSRLSSAAQSPGRPAGYPSSSSPSHPSSRHSSRSRPCFLSRSPRQITPGDPAAAIDARWRSASTRLGTPGRPQDNSPSAKHSCVRNRSPTMAKVDKVFATVGRLQQPFANLGAPTASRANPDAVANRTSHANPAAPFETGPAADARCPVQVPTGLSCKGASPAARGEHAERGTAKTARPTSRRARLTPPRRLSHRLCPTRARSAAPPAEFCRWPIPFDRTTHCRTRPDNAAAPGAMVSAAVSRVSHESRLEIGRLTGC